MLICCLGMKRSGSTWQYNVVRHMVEQLGLGEAQGYIPEDEALTDQQRLLAWARDSRVHLIKTHARVELDRRLFDAGKVKITYTYRDLRAVAQSLNRQFGARGDRLRKLLDEAVDVHRWVSQMPATLMQRYEDFTSQPRDAVFELAAFLGWPLRDSQVSEIVEACSSEAMKRVADAESRSLKKVIYHSIWHINRRLPVKRWLLAAGFPERWWLKLRAWARPYDARTLLRPGHVSGADGQTGTLADEERRQIEERYRAWLADAGYR